MAMTAFRAKVKGAKRSKLVWLGLALALSGFAEAQFQLVQHLLPEQWRGPALMGIGGLVIVLRFMTTLPLDELVPDTEPTPPDNDPPA
jgi:hypothetical protein